MQFQNKAIHFVGIGGCGMSGAALVVRSKGAVVSGTDRSATSYASTLIAKGVKVSFDQSGAALPDKCDLLVVSAAIPDHHPERLLAKKRGVSEIKYSQLLGLLMREKCGVAI